MRSLIAAVLLLLFLPAQTLAHSPLFLQDGSRVGVREHDAITDPERSWAIYGDLAPGRTADVIPIVAQKGQKLYLQLLVPQKPELRTFRPRVLLVGPGLPPMPQQSQPVSLPVKPAAGLGMLLLPEPQEPEAYYEEFTQTHYWVYGELEGIFPETGTFRLVVFDPAGQGGPYTVALGKREQFSLLDFLTFPLIWARTRVWLWK